MDMTRIQKVNDYCWTVGGRVMFYGSETLIRTMDDKVYDQITNVAQLPGLVGPAMTMPDAHWGYGFPIGGVAAFSAEQGGIISAGGVGFDISCGVRCLRTNFTWDQAMRDRFAIADLLFNTIPIIIESMLKNFYCLTIRKIK